MGSRIIKPVPSFSPRQLFARGRQGVWVEPELNGTLFTDYTGATAASAGSTVGLALDAQKQTVLGPELLTNGDFSSGGTGWLNQDPARWTFSAGQAHHTAGGTLGPYQPIGTVNNTAFSVTYTITAISGGSFQILFGGGPDRTTLRSTTGTFTEIVNVSSGNGNLIISSTSDFVGSIDNLSCKKVLYRALQSTSANRPTLQQSGNLYFLRHDGTDYLTATLPAINVRRNLLTYSEQFDNAVWSYSRSSTSRNFVLGPNGIGVGYPIIEDSTGGLHESYTSYSAVAGTVYTFSVFVKASAKNYVFVQLSKGGTNKGAYFDVLNGSVGGIDAGYSASIQPVNGGWFRCSVTLTADSTETYYPGTIIANSISTKSYVGVSGTVGLYRYGAQVKVGPADDQYQKITDWTSELYSSAGSVYFGTPQGMSSIHNQSIGTSYNLPAPNTDIYGWCVVPSRLTPPEEEQLARYFRAKAGIVGSEDYFWQGEYGPELAVNGNFATGDLTGWTTSVFVGLTRAVVANTLVVTADATITGAGGTYQDITVIPGQSYLVSVKAKVVSGPGTAFLRLGQGSAVRTMTDWDKSTTSTDYVTLSSVIKVTTSVLCVYLRFAFNLAETVANYDDVAVTQLTGMLTDDSGEQLLLRA